MSIDIIGDTIYYMNKPVADIREDVMPSFRDKFECELMPAEITRKDAVVQEAYDEGYDAGKNDASKHKLVAEIQNILDKYS